MDQLYKCQKGVMEKCPENKPGGKCEGTYIGDDCWCAKRNQQYMPESERDLLKRYRDTGIPPEVCAEYKKFEDELVKGGIPFGHVIDLLAAEKDGRLVVLPCSVETLMERYNALRLPTGDDCETYSTGYRSGHKNGQAELLEYLLQIDTATRAEAEDALRKEQGND